MRIPRISAGFRSHKWYSTVVTSQTTQNLPYKGLSLPYNWLRDSCQCPRCLHPSTRQKLHPTSDIPTDVRPAPNGIRYADNGVYVEWAPDHHSFYPNEFLDLYISPSNLREYHGNVEQCIWDVDKLKQSSDLYVSYGSLFSVSGLYAATTQLLRYGLVFVTGVPTAHTSNETCELRTLAQKFSDIRTTFYGETWDVKAVRESRNIAYTNVFLGLHMDLMCVVPHSASYCWFLRNDRYFENPPR